VKQRQAAALKHQGAASNLNIVAAIKASSWRANLNGGDEGGSGNFLTLWRA